MKQLYLPFQCDNKGEISVRGPDFHYLAHVLRFKQGTSFTGLDSKGKRYRLYVLKIGQESLTLSVTAIKSSENLSMAEKLPVLSLFQAIPKGKVMDRIIRQATEAGISMIIPVISQYTIIDLKSDKTIDNKLQRWRRITKEAVQQSGAGLLPYIGEPMKIGNAIDICRGLKLFFNQYDKDFITLNECLSIDIHEINLFIGPEGGFSDSEYNLLKKKGFIPINLGKTVLRVDTAALFALAAVKVIVSEKENWRKV